MRRGRKIMEKTAAATEQHIEPTETTTLCLPKKGRKKTLSVVALSSGTQRTGYVTKERKCVT